MDASVGNFGFSVLTKDTLTWYREAGVEPTTFRLADRATAAPCLCGRHLYVERRGGALVHDKTVICLKRHIYSNKMLSKLISQEETVKSLD